MSHHETHARRFAREITFGVAQVTEVAQDAVEVGTHTNALVCLLRRRVERDVQRRQSALDTLLRARTRE